MANHAHSMLFLSTVYKWQVLGEKRVRSASSGTQFLLNTNRLDAIRVKTDVNISGIKASCYYFDEPLDHRDNSHYMEQSLTAAELITQIDTTPTHTHMTLPLFPNMDTAEATVNHTIHISDFAFAVDVTDSNSGSHSLIWYTDKAFKLVRGRVDLSLAELLALIA